VPNSVNPTVADSPATPLYPTVRETSPRTQRSARPRGGRASSAPATGRRTGQSDTEMLPAHGSNRRKPKQIDALTQCYESWDKGTHLTTRRWRQLCRRNLVKRDRNDIL
jgi:hypothetical protein